VCVPSIVPHQQIGTPIHGQQQPGQQQKRAQSRKGLCLFIG
jgi:hypothetical protein